MLLHLAACSWYKQCYMPAVRSHAAHHPQLSVHHPLLSQIPGSRLALCVCRICRKTVKDPDLLIQVPDADSLALAETILRAGSSQFPSSAYLLLVKAGIQTHLKGDQAVRLCLVACGPAVI